MNVNEALGLITRCKSRIKSLEELRDKVSTIERFYGSAERSKEPTYTVQEVDSLLVKLTKLLYKLETAVKQSNALTVLNLDSGIETDIIFEELK